MIACLYDAVIVRFYHVTYPFQNYLNYLNFRLHICLGKVFPWNFCSYRV